MDDICDQLNNTQVIIAWATSLLVTNVLTYLISRRCKRMSYNRL